MSRPNNNPFEFSRYQDWGKNFFPIIALRDGKPLPHITHADLWYRVPSEDRKAAIRLAAEQLEATGAAWLLDSPEVGNSLCFVDVDDASKIPQVRRFLGEKLGIMYLVEVTTGRGVHIYFRREAGYEAEFKTGQAKLFGKFTKGSGDEAFCVDLRGHGSPGIMPGSLYDKRAKGLPLGKYYWGGVFGHQDPESIEEFLAACPVMPLALWKEMEGPRAQADLDLSVIEDEDPRWAKVTPGFKIQDCPFCGNKTFKPSKIRGAYACFHADCRGDRQARIYMPASARLQVAQFVDLEKDLVVADWVHPPRKIGEDPVGWAVDQAADILAWAPDRAALGAIFPEGDPLKAWESEAAFAAALAERAELFETPLACSRGPTTFVASGKVQKRISGSCFSFACEECGPKMKELLRCAVAASVLETEFSKRISNINSNTYYIRNTPEAYWASVAYEEKSFRALANRINRWASAHEGSGWLGMRVTPTRAVVVAWAEEPGALASWPLAEGAVGPAPVLSMVTEALGEVDLGAWRTWVEEEKARRIAAGDTAGVRVKILLAPADFKGKVEALLDFLSGHNRAKFGGLNGRALIGQGWARPPAPREAPEKGEDFHTITTYRTREMHKFLEEKLQETLRPKVVKATTTARVEVVELPCAAAPLQAAFVAAHPNLHAHRGSKIQARLAVVLDSLL